MSRSSLLEDDNVLDVSPFIVNDEDIQAKAKQAEEQARRTKLLIGCLVALLFCSMGNKIFQILQMIPMENYPLFLSNLTTFAYIPLSFAYIVPMQYFGSAITPEMEAVPKMWFFYIGALDSLAGIMQTLSINYVQNGTLVVLVMQLAIPISMIISRFMLKARYRASQLVGCFVVACGLAVVLIPTFLTKKKKDNCEHEISNSTLAIALGVLVISNVPMCLSTVVKEKTLGDADVDPIYLNGWVALFQFIIGIPLILPAAPTVDVKIKDIPSNLWDGAKCYVGINSVIDRSKSHDAINKLASFGGLLGGVTPKTNFSSRALTAMSYGMTQGTSAMFTADDDKKEEVVCDNTTYDDCALAPVYVNLYMFFNVLYNILIILIIKYGNANMVWMAMTITVPLSSVAFSLSFMPKSKPLKTTDIIGLVVILLGLIVYRFFVPIRQKLFGKTLEDIAEEQHIDDEHPASQPINAVQGITGSDDFIYEATLITSSQPSSLGNNDSYMPPSSVNNDEYTEAEIAPGIDVNAAVAGKKKKKFSKK